MLLSCDEELLAPNQLPNRRTDPCWPCTTSYTTCSQLQ